VADHIRFVGPRPHSEIAEWLSAADLSVLPTRSEGWPNALLESLACGTPVVATRVGGTPEIVRDGEDGLLVPYGQPVALVHAIQQALQTPWDRDAMVCRARRFDWNDSTERALQELTSAIEAHS
jgi:glycosyltransferase involved in cell wall biosynthesis